MAKETKEYTLKWAMQDDKLIRFLEVEEAFDLNDAVAKLDLAKAGIVDGTKVTVEIEGNVVTYLTKSKSATQLPPATQQTAKTDAPKADSAPTTPTGQGTTKVATVAGISPKFKGITFGEKNGEKDIWYDIVDAIGVENLPKMGIARGTKVEVIVEAPQGKSKNGRIVGIKVVETKEAPKAEPSTGGTNDFDKNPPATDAPTDSKDAFYRLKQAENKIRYLENVQRDSIEAQGAVERAFTLVGSMISKETAEANVKNKENIKGLLKEFSKEAYTLIQELKKP